MASPLNLQVVDVGARYEFHLSITLFLDRCETILIEISPEEAKSQTTLAPYPEVMDCCSLLLSIIDLMRPQRSTT